MAWSLGRGGSGGTDGWEPSVKYLLVLIVAEIVLFGVLQGFLNRGR